jgi:GAF domain-containing protein
VCRLAVGPKSTFVHAWRLSAGDGIAGWVADIGESVIVPDARADERLAREISKPSGLEPRSVLSVPMRVKQEVIGVLQLVDTKADRFGTSELTLLESLTASAAVAIDNARLYEKAQQEIAERVRAEQARERLIAELEEALTQVQQLEGFLPICSYCKKIRDDQNYWQQVETYIERHSEALFTHSICPDCFQEFAVPELKQLRSMKENQ